jgi:hypothetical protein
MLTTRVGGKDVNYNLVDPNSLYQPIYEEAFKFSYMCNHIIDR